MDVYDKIVNSPKLAADLRIPTYLPKPGHFVRSFEGECRRLVGPWACYVEGEVVSVDAASHAMYGPNCRLVEIRVTRRVFNGVDQEVDPGERVFPPINGLPLSFKMGCFTNGIERIG